MDKEQRIRVSIDWNKVPKGNAGGFVKIHGPYPSEVKVKINSFNPENPTKDSLDGFIEANGYISIEAEHYTKKVDAGKIRWEKIEDYGRTLSAMTIFPVTAKSVTPGRSSPHLEYKMYLFNPRDIELEAIFAPTLNFVPGQALRYAVSFDNQPPQIIEIASEDYLVHWKNRQWNESVIDSVCKIKSTHTISKAGYHTLKIWMVDPGVVLQKIIIDTGGLKPSYLGPPESYHNSK